MPTYEYECTKCGHRLEKFQQMSEPPLKKCPKCQGKLKRLLGSGAGIIFKGSGFYQTDYRSASYTEKAKKEKEGAGGAAPKKDSHKTEKKNSKTDTSSSSSTSTP